MTSSTNSSRYLKNLRAIKAARRFRKIDFYYPEEGRFRRGLYGKHVEFFAAGGVHRERLFLAANQTGKTTAGAYEVTCHLTGIYPDWWAGKRFDTAIKAWAAGETGKKTREVVQERLLGPAKVIGTGMIPADAIAHKSMKSGVPDAVDTVWVKHVSGGKSSLTFKSYEQGREGFDGDVVHVIWLDEEGPMDIYTECLLRTANSDGIVIVTFTPLQGLTDLVLSFLPGGKVPE